MVYLGADHRGFKLKEQIKTRLKETGREFQDLGNERLDGEDDYVDFARLVAEGTVQDQENRGIVICGSGVGVDITANKIPGVRSALVFDTQRAKQSREHEDVNVLALAADIIGLESAWEIVEAFLTTPFPGEVKHQRRLEKLAEIEKKYFK